MAKKVVLAGACRTAIGTMGGALSTTPAPVLGSIVIKEALNRAGVPADQVDHVYMGCVIQAGLGQNVARQASLKAGLPIETPAVTVNVVCGSGLNCVNMAAQMIQAGDADIVVAGGMENMSMAPYAAMNARFGYRMNNGKLVDTMVNDALWDAFNDYHMIKTADNICEQWGLTREELDVFAANSQQKAAAAQESGAFDAEIVPVMVKKKKETIEFKKDEGPRPGTTVETLAKLRTINPGGFVTAGNASGINDGAAAIICDNAGADASIEAVQKAYDAGIPTFLIDREINQSGLAVAQIVADNAQGAAAIAEVWVEAMNYEGKYAELLGLESDTNCQVRSNAFHRVLDQTDMKMVAQQSANWDQTEGQSKAETILQQYPDITAIVCGNDTMACGAAAAVAAANLDHDVYIIGVDGSNDMRDNIKDGKALATALQQIDKITRNAVTQANDYLTNGTTGLEEKQLVDCVVITKDNADKLDNFVFAE